MFNLTVGGPEVLGAALSQAAMLGWDDAKNHRPEKPIHQLVKALCTMCSIGHFAAIDTAYKAGRYQFNCLEA